LWVITNLACEAGLRTYGARMKIQETFKDIKSLLGLGKVMNKDRENMEKTVAMLLIAYTIGVLVGEEMRDQAYGRGKKNGTCTRASSYS
ncbi:MAG TPA: IS4/IS5 family transposase, partial [Thermoleophilia bacterium]|nr:IS4/IS5 family transposase [Thermoleophilia bacterium]